MVQKPKNYQSIMALHKCSHYPESGGFLISGIVLACSFYHMPVAKKCINSEPTFFAYPFQAQNKVAFVPPAIPMYGLRFFRTHCDITLSYESKLCGLISRQFTIIIIILSLHDKMNISKQ